MSSGRNFPPRGRPLRSRCSTSKPQRPSLLSTQRRDLILNGGPPSFIRFPRPPIKWSPVASATCSSSPSASVVGANNRSSVSSGSHSADVASLDANYRSSASPSSPAAVADSQLKYDVFISLRGPDSRDNFVSHLYDDLRRAGTEVKSLRQERRLSRLYRMRSSDQGSR